MRKEVSLVVMILVGGCSVDVNLKQKTPIVIRTETEGEVTAKVAITIEMDVASQVEQLCGGLQGDTLRDCSNRVISIYESLTKLVEMISQNKGGI